MTAQSKGQVATRNGQELAVYEVDPIRWSETSSLLETQGYRVRNFNSTPDALASLRSHERPALLIVATDSAGTDLAGLAPLFSLARELGLPTLAILESGADLKAATEQDLEIFDWVVRASVTHELSARVDGLLRRQVRKQESSGTAAPTMPTDPRFFPLIVHDLRTPLNVVGLSLRMIDQALPRGNPDLEEDLRFVEESFKQIERMLAQLSDYYRLYEPDAPPVESTEFSPERLLSEVVESRNLKAGGKAVPIHVEVHQSCPPEAQLDPRWAKQAIQYALGNAVAASKVEGVHVTLHGGPDRWVTEFSVKQPPPSTVTSVTLRPDLFERLCGTASERRGMDLAIAARISELFGGAARLEVDESRGSTIILDWPVRSEPK